MQNPIKQFCGQFFGRCFSFSSKEEISQMVEGNCALKKNAEELKSISQRNAWHSVKYHGAVDIYNLYTHSTAVGNKISDTAEKAHAKLQSDYR